MENELVLIAHVEITVIDLSVYDDENNSEETMKTLVGTLLHRLLGSATCCCEADDCLKQISSSSSLNTAALNAASSETELCKDIERFVRARDRLLALASILLKSRAFHQSYFSLSDESNGKESQGRRALVRLPRTEHRKPFIPRPCRGDNNSKVESLIDDGSLSVSHQFPFAGSATILPRKDRATTSQNQSSVVKVGCDIVVKESSLNTRLYNTWDDFLKVFEFSFHYSEWAIITSAETVDARLHEFYLRWAVKEAYTKALGVGLGFDFASFSVQFQLPDSCDQRLWGFLEPLQQSKDGAQHISLRGVIVMSSLDGSLESNHQGEAWLFYFVPLSPEPSSWASVAVGPIIDNNPPNIKLQVQETSLESLIAEYERP